MSIRYKTVIIGWWRLDEYAKLEDVVRMVVDHIRNTQPWWNWHKVKWNIKLGDLKGRMYDPLDSRRFTHITAYMRLNYDSRHNG